MNARAWSGKLCIVTGANSGVGAAITRALARAGATVVMVCRDRERAQGAQRQITAESPGAQLPIELADLRRLSDVQALAARLRSQFTTIDLLVNNAGVYRSLREMTDDGFEVTFAVNHLAHFALTLGLIDALIAARGIVLNVSSGAHRAGKLRRTRLEAVARGEGTYRGVQAYCDAKLANVLFTSELAARYGNRGVTAVAMHPGALRTSIWHQNKDLLSKLMRVFEFLLRPPHEGAHAAMHLISLPREQIQGAYFEKQVRATPAPLALDQALASELWTLSERLVRR